MKIVLIQPPIQDFYDTDIRLQPIGLGYLKSVAAKFHPDVGIKILDFHQGHRRHPIAWPKELGYLKDYYQYPDKSPFRSFYHYFHFGASYEVIEQTLRAENPDVIGISSLFTPYFREALQIARIAKKLFPDRPVLFGGSHVNADPHQVLSHKEVDYVIRGEGERPFVEFISFLKNKIAIQQVSNLGFKVESNIIFNAQTDNYSIDELPFPDFTDLDKNSYLYGPKALTFLITSRSCPHRCSFCSVHQTFGSSYRKRSVENVLNEIKLRYEQGYRIIDFEDDNLTFYKNQMKELCRRIISEIPRDLEFVAMNGISYISLDDELLDLMRRAGFTHLNLALVSSDQFVREATKRPHTIDKYLSVVDRARSLGFKIVSYQILGLPNESLESMTQTLAFGARLPILLGASMFYLTPNSPIAKNFPPRTESDQFLARLTSMHIETESFKREDLFTLFITTRIVDFLKSFDLQNNLSLSEVLELAPQQSFHARGQRLLRRLFEEQILYADVGQKDLPLPKFKYSLFKSALDQMQFIHTMNGGHIWTTPATMKQAQSFSDCWMDPYKSAPKYGHLDHEIRGRT